MLQKQHKESRTGFKTDLGSSTTSSTIDFDECSLQAALSIAESSQKRKLGLILKTERNKKLPTSLISNLPPYSFSPLSPDIWVGWAAGLSAEGL